MQQSITTERLILRRWRDSDREPFARINADPIAMRFMPSRYSREESDALIDRIEAHFDHHGFGLFAAELREGSTFLGYVGLSIPRFQATFTPCVEIGWRLAPAYWNRGYATEGARAVRDFAFDEFALKELLSFTIPANLPSRRVMEKIGMTRSEADDFEHPNIPDGHPMRRHVLYRLTRQQWQHMRTR